MSTVLGKNIYKDIDIYIYIYMYITLLMRRVLTTPPCSKKKGLAFILRV